MLRIGFSATYGFASILDAASFAKEHGFNAVEINLNMPEFYPDRYGKPDRKHIRDKLDDEGFTLTFHAPEDINLSTKQELIEDASLEILKRSIDFAHDLGAKRFTFHIGDSVNFTMFDGSVRLEEYYENEYTQILKDAMSKLLAFSGDKIVLCAENTGFFGGAKKNAIKSLLGSGLYLTWDLGHSYIKKNQMDFMLQNISYIRNMHLHDVKGGKDHSIIGSGEIDFPYYISKLHNMDVIYVIEVRPKEAAYKSLLGLKSIMENNGNGV